MKSRDDEKRIERRARSLLIGKEIPPHKQEVVRTLMNNRRLKPGEKYRAIIELVQTCPDKKVTVVEEEAVPAAPARRKREASRDQKERDEAAPAELAAPTETSYYIDELMGRYRRLNLFRRRWLVHRNNRFGIGIRKRLVPTRHFLRVLGYLGERQAALLGRLTEAMMEILRDPAEEDPIVFNHLRLVRKWLVDVPLARLRYESVKWMERAQFDRELRTWVIPFFSFLRMEGGLRERMMAEVDRRLRAMEDLRKEDHLDGEPDSYRRDKEKRNLEREKQIYEIMMTLRSFLPVDPAQNCLLSRRLREKFNVGSLFEFITAAEEALVFQRPIRRDEIETHYGIGPPLVSLVAWDYSEEFLATIGKDAESLRKKKKDVFRKELERYETVALLLKITDGGRNLLLAGAEDQWRYVDRKHYDPKVMYNENFIVFIDALVQYFNSVYIPLIDGSPVVFRDMARQEHEGSLFSFSVMQPVIERFNRVLGDLHFFRTGNPTMAVGRDDIKNIMGGRGGPLAHLEPMLRSLGDCLYGIAKALQAPYDRHRRWATGRSGPAADGLIRQSLTDGDLVESGEPRPLPYYDCVIKEADKNDPLSRDLSGRRVLEDSLRDGVYVRMNAFAYQAAYECRSERLMADLEERKALLQKIEESKE